MLRRKFTRRQKVRVAIISLLSAILLVVGHITVLSKGPLSFISVDHMFTIAILLAILPSGLLDLADARWRSNADSNIPRLLVDIAGYVRSGQNIVKALELAAERDYGVLTPELRKFKAKLSWGVPVDKAVLSLGESIGTLLARRVFLLLNYVITSGGRVNEVMGTIVRHVSELRVLESERRATLKPYIFTTYIAFFVFLATAVLLFKGFFVDLARTQQAGGPFQVAINLDAIRSVFYQLSVVEAAVGGLVAGKLGEGTFGSGIKHVIVLLLITILVFTVFV